jgi:hypothetical protein
MLKVQQKKHMRLSSKERGYVGDVRNVPRSGTGGSPGRRD